MTHKVYSTESVTTMSHRLQSNINLIAQAKRYKASSDEATKRDMEKRMRIFIKSVTLSDDVSVKCNANGKVTAKVIIYVNDGAKTLKKSFCSTLN